VRDAAALGAVAVVAGDPRRCEFHDQCEGLSRRVFRSPGHRLRVPLGPGSADSLAALTRSVRSCPVDALRIDTTHTHDSPDPEEH
jgi:ferredoxin